MSSFSSLFSLRNRFTATLVLAALVLAVSACGSQDNGGQESGGEQGQSTGPEGQTMQPTSPETTGGMGLTSMESTSMGGETTSMSEETTGMEAPVMEEETTSMRGGTTGGATMLAGGPQDEIRDGTWRVGGAGTVRFQFAGGGVELGQVDPNSGWEQRVVEQSDDQIEVQFTRDDTDRKFQVEVDGDQAEISTQRDIQPAEAGTYQVGDAAEVEFDSTDESLSLENVDARDGWRITEEDESSDDIEINFARDDVTAEFEAEQNDGQIDLETSQKVSGPVPE